MEKFRLKAKVYYSDGTNSGNQWALPQTTGLKVGSIVTYPAGFKTLGLDLLDTEKTPVSYDLWLVNNNGATVSQVRSYTLRDQEYNELQLWFQNSLGVLEAVSLRSNHTYGVQVDKQEFLKSSPFAVSNTEHEIATAESELEENYTASTGYMSRSAIAPYIDMLMSKHVWWIDGGQRVPITIAPGQFEIVKASIADGVYDFAINFSFTKAFSQNAFSNQDA